MNKSSIHYESPVTGNNFMNLWGFIEIISKNNDFKKNVLPLNLPYTEIYTQYIVISFFLFPLYILRIHLNANTLFISSNWTLSLLEIYLRETGW